MADIAVELVSDIEDELHALALGDGTDLALSNVHSHVQNGLQHIHSTPQIDAAAERVRMLAEQFGRDHGGMSIGQQAKDARARHLENLREAYLALRGLLAAAEPNDVSRTLGGG